MSSSSDRPHPQRCPDCESRTLFDETMLNNGESRDIRIEEVIEGNGRCNTCGAHIHPVTYPSGKQIMKTSESPLHILLKLITAGRFATEGEDRTVVLDMTIGDNECDVGVYLPHEEIKGLAVEVIVDNKLNIESKREDYRDEGFVPICIYPYDVVNFLDLDKIYEREFRKITN